MSRPVDEQRPAELRDAILRYLSVHGLANLSLRPLAKAVHSSPRALLYHFGSKENMVAAVVAELRRRQRATYGTMDAPDFRQACLQAWRDLSSAESEPQFRLFFEVFGFALRRPQHYKSFLHDTIEDWLKLIADALVREGHEPDRARAFATVVLAGLRGLMLDYCATHDRARLDRAVGMWAESLDAMLAGKTLDGEHGSE